MQDIFFTAYPSGSRNAQDYDDPGPDGATGDVVAPDEYDNDVEAAAADIAEPKISNKNVRAFAKPEPEAEIGIGRKKRK